MVPEKCVYEGVSQIDGMFKKDLTVDLGWTEKWSSNAKYMIDIISR
jgi:hypothetical protein